MTILLLGSGGREHALASVSYTHLDVYKRQDLRRCDGGIGLDTQPHDRDDARKRNQDRDHPCKDGVVDEKSCHGGKPLSVLLRVGLCALRVCGRLGSRGCLVLAGGGGRLCRCRAGCARRRRIGFPCLLYTSRCV